MAGKCSWVLVLHDSIDYAKDDPEFGRKLADAILSPRRGHDTTMHVSASSAACKGSGTVAMVVGNYFNGDVGTQIAVCEKGAPWLANGFGKPEWSNLTKGYAMHMIFGPPKPKLQTKKIISKLK